MWGTGSLVELAIYVQIMRGWENCRFKHEQPQNEGFLKKVSCNIHTQKKSCIVSPRISMSYYSLSVRQRTQQHAGTPASIVSLATACSWKAGMTASYKKLKCCPNRSTFFITFADYCYNDRVWGHRAEDVDGEDRGIVFLRLRNILLRSSCGESPYIFVVP